MPVGFNSPARNFFLLGSSGDGVVGNFFDTIDRSAGTDGVYLPDEIRYNYTDQKYLLAGSASDSASKSFGWFEKRDETGVAEFENRIEATQTVINTTLRAMELDINNNLIVAGFSGSIPWIAKYSNSGVLDWQSTTNSANVRYLGLTSDSNGNYYACGRTSYAFPDTQAFVEKFDTNGNPSWGKSAFMLGRDVVLKSIAANSRGEVVAVGFLEDDSADKGYIVKIDTNTGDVLWDRTLSPDDGIELKCTDVYIDNQDQIYVSVNGTDDGYLVKYTPEGNIQWQRKTAQSSGSITYDQVFSDGETQQTVVFGTYTDSGDTSGLLTKYSRNGDLVWRRTLTSSFNNSDTFASVCLDGDPSFYYFMYIDGIIDGLNGTPDAYTFGKVSSSGNGLGAFQYTEGTGETIDYVILNEPDKIGRLSDGSVRHDTSDLIAYPFGATKIMFDDLAAKVTNKKRQMDDADSFEYSGSPAIRPADFQELNLLGHVYSGSGDWLDQSGKGNDGVVDGATYNAAGYFNFDGVNDEIDFGNEASIITSGSFTVEAWAWRDTRTTENGLFNIEDSNQGVILLSAGNNGPNGQDYRFLVRNGTFGAGNQSNIEGNLANVGLNEWHHYVGVYDDNTGTATMFVDGVQVDTVTNAGTRGYSFSGTLDSGIHIGPSAGRGRWHDGRIGEVRVYPRALTGAAVFQNYNATKSKYINEAPDTAPRIGPGIVVDSDLLLNYDFGNRATFDTAQNLMFPSNVATLELNDGGATQLSVDYTIKDPFGQYDGVLKCNHTSQSPGYFRRGRDVNLTAGKTYTFSFYFKNDTITEPWEGRNTINGPAFSVATFSPTFESNVKTLDKNIPVGNGWYKQVFTFTPGYTQSYQTTFSIANNQTPIGSFYIAGFQLEEGSVARTYIKTYGSAITAPNTVKNLRSSSYTGTLNGPTFDLAGRYFETNGSGDHMTIPGLSVSGTGGFTVELWMRLTGLQSGTTWNYFVRDEDGLTPPQYEIGVYGNDNYNWIFKQNSISQSVSTVLTQNQWHHICFGVNASAQLGFIYRDGIFAGGNSNSFSTGALPLNKLFGNFDTSSSIAGQFGEIRAYDRELSGAEVLANFNATRSKYGV